MKIKFTILPTSTDQSQEDLKKIYQAVYVEEQKIAADLVFARSESDSIQTFILYVDDQVASTGRVRFLHEEKKAKIERMATIKKFRGEGYGKKILIHLIQLAQKEYPQYQLITHSQKTANGFYEGMGWIKEGKEFLEAKIVHQKYIYPRNL